MLFLDRESIHRQPWRDTARLAMQSTVAAVATYLIMSAAGLPEMFIGVLSAAIVIQPSAGNAAVTARDRVLATLLGSTLALVCFLVFPLGYGAAVALGAAVLLIHIFAGFRPELRYGVVAVVALSVSSEGEPWQTAIDRSIALGIGVVTGLLVSAIVWPDSAPRRARRHLRRALQATSRRLDTTLEDAEIGQARDQSERRHQFHFNLHAARDAAEGAFFGKSKHLLDQLDQAEKLYNSVLILNRVTEEGRQALGADEDFRRDVERMREIAADVIAAISEGKPRPGESLREYTRCLDGLSQKVARHANPARAHVLQNALVFGLGEVRNGLENLAAAIETAGPGKGEPAGK